METNVNTQTETALPTFLQTLTSLRDWATDSIRYVRRRNHLSSQDKQDIYARLEQYANHLDSLIKSYTDGKFDTDSQALTKTLETYQQGQAKMNWYAMFYEFPACALAEHITVSNSATKYITAKVTTDSLAKVMFEDDELICEPISDPQTLEPNCLVVVIFRPNYRRPRRMQVGWLNVLDDEQLTLTYTSQRLEKQLPDWSISRQKVIHIHKVLNITRDVE